MHPSEYTENQLFNLTFTHMVTISTCISNLDSDDELMLHAKDFPLDLLNTPHLLWYPILPALAPPPILPHLQNWLPLPMEA